MKNQYYSDFINKINLLIEQKKYQTAQLLIDEELRIPYIPPDILTELETLKLKIHHLKPGSQPSSHMMTSPEKVLDQLVQPLLSEEAAMEVLKLSYFNINPYIDKILLILINPNVTNATKTHLCFLLKYNNYNFPVVVYKYNQKHIIDNLKKVENFTESTFINNITKSLNSLISHHDVNTYNITLQLLRLAFDDVFPDITQLKNDNLMCGTLIYLAQKMQGQKHSINTQAQKFKVFIDDLKQSINKWEYLIYL